MVRRSPRMRRPGGRSGFTSAACRATRAAWRYVGNPSSLIFGEQLGRRSPSWLILEIDVCERLADVVAHDEAGIVVLVDRPRWRSGANRASGLPAAACPTFAAPIFFRLTLHCRRCRVFDFAPMVDPTGTVARAESLRHNTLATERAGMLEDHRAVAAEVPIEGDAVSDTA